MNELIKQLYGSYAPNIQLTDTDINNITNVYGDNMLKFVNDFDKSYLQPNNQTFQKDLYQQIYDYQTSPKNQTNIETQTPEVETPGFTPKPQGVNDWFDVENRDKLGKKAWFQETADAVIIPTLREKYSSLGFEFSPRQQVYGFNVVATAPNGEKMDIIIGDKDSDKNFIDFVNKNMPSTDSDEYKLYEKSMKNRTELAAKLPSASDEELNELRLNINNNVDLFKPITKKISGYMMDHTTEIQPYQDELKLAENILNQQFESQFLDEGGTISPRHRGAIKKPTRSDIEKLARDLVYDNAKTKLNKDKRYDMLNDMSKEDRAKYNLAVREEYQDQDAEEYAKDQDNYENDIVFFDIDQNVEYVNKFQKGELDLTEYVPLKDEKMLELKNGMKIPERTFNKYVEASRATNAKIKNLINRGNQLDTRFDKIKNSSEKMDLLKRDFNLFNNFLNNMGTFTGEHLAYGTVRALSTLSRPKPRFYDDKETYEVALKDYNDRWEKLDLQMQDWADTRRGKDKDVLEFADVKMGENFSQFFVHELSQFLPIIASIYGVGAVSGGSRLAVFSGMSTPGMGARLKDFTVEEKTNPFADRHSDEYKMLWSAAHGMAEGFWETVTTFRLLNQASKSFGGIFKQGFNNGLKKFWKKAPENLGYAGLGAGSESIGEGMTQLTQNWIDERPWIEGLDHSMAVGLMFGTGMSISPVISGYLGSKFGDAEKFKRVGEAVDKRKTLMSQYNNLDKRTIAAKEINLEIKKIDDQISREIIDQDKLKLDKNDFNLYKKAVLRGFEIREKAEEIANNESIPDEIKQDRLENLELAAAGNRRTINEFVGGRSSLFKLLKESNDIKDVNKYEEILNKTRDENPQATDEEIINLGEETYYYELVDKDLKTQRENIKNSGLNVNLKGVKTKAQAITILNKLIKESSDLLKKSTLTPEQQKAVTKQIALWERKKEAVKDGRENGWIDPINNGLNGYNAYVIKDNAVTNRKAYTASHEVGHAITWEALGKNEKKEIMPFAETILGNLEQYDKKAYGKIEREVNTLNDKTRKDKSYDPTEVISEFFELVSENQVNYKQSTPFLSIQMKKIFGLDLSPGNDMYNFVESLGKQLRDGTLTKESLKKQDFTTAVETKSSIRPDLQKAYQEARDKINPKAEKYTDNWTPENADVVWQFALDNNIFDSYILGKRPDGVDPEVYLYDSYVELLKAFRNFKTSNVDKKGRPDIFGWIMGQLGYKTLNVKKRIFEEQKKKSKKVDLDKAKDIVAPESTKPVTQETKEKFAQEINIDDKTIKSLNDALRVTLRLYQETITEGATKNVTITPIMRAINNELTKRYGDIVTFMGKKEEYRDFLTKNKIRILNKVKTTYLAKNMPELVLKSVGGKYAVDDNGAKVLDSNGNPIFEPNWVSDWKGKKVDREKAAVTGRTSGNQLIQKNDQAIQKLKDEDFLNIFFKDGKPIQNKKEGLAKELAQRIGRDILNNDLLDKGPLSQTFKDSQEIYNNIVNENFASVLLAQSDLSSKSSVKTIRDLSKNKEEYKYFKEEFKNVADDVVNGQLPYVSALKRIRALVEDELIKDTRTGSRSKKLAEGVQELYDQYAATKQLLIEPGETFEDFSKYAQAELRQLNFNDLFSAYIKRQGITDKSITDLFKDENLVNKQRLITLKFGEDLVEMYGLEKAIELMYKFFRGHTITAGKTIGKRNQSFGNLQDFTDNVIKQMDLRVKNIELETKVNKKGEESQSLKKIIINRNGKDVDILSEVNDKGEKIIDLRLNSITGNAGMNITFDKSKKEAKEAEDLLKMFLEYVAENHNKVDFAMTIASLNSNQSTMLRRAANVFFKYTGPKGVPLKYEHMIPANYMAVQLTDYYLNKSNIDIDKLFEQYTVAIIPEPMADLVDTRYESWMHDGWQIGDDTTKRYYNNYFYAVKKIVTAKGKIKPVSMYAMEDVDGNVYGEQYTNEAIELANAENQLESKSSVFKNSRDFVVAMRKSADLNAKEKGASIIDFDDTLATSNSKIIVNFTDGTQQKITPAEFAEQASELELQDATFDFREFNEVKGGKKGPFLGKALSLQKKFGSKDMFVLTARPQAAAPAIHKFLEGVGLNIPLENITGLEDGTPQAKAQHIVKMAADGYNNFLFADDAIKNVKAVAEAIDALDVNGKVYKLRSKHSQTIKAKTLDTILDENNPDSPVTGKKKLTGEEATFYGKPKAWYKTLLDLRSKTNLIFVPPSAEDLRGLWNNHIAGEGKKGEADILWFEETIVRPYARGERLMDSLRLLMIDELSLLYKQFGKDFKKEIKQEGFSGIFTKQDAIRMYIWDKLGYDIPGSKTAIKTAIAKLKADEVAVDFANQLLNNVYQDSRVANSIEYVKPNKSWKDQSIDSDITSSVLLSRKNLYQEFNNNKEKVFTKENMNKIEAIYGVEFRKALEDIFFRMENGVNRSAADMNNFWIKWLNAGVGNVMFINVRSALLQTTSFTNFIDVIGDNNPVTALARFADFKTFKKDMLMLWNSKFLRARRLRGKIDISMNEILEDVDSSKEFFWKLSKKMQELGYKPTQLGDSFAIALGGASFYRNRYNTYVKAGRSTGESHNRAMRDLRERAEETQQSSRADLISQQQASVAGRVFLSFQNVTMQYTRIAKKLLNDIKNRRRVKKPDGTYYNVNQSRLLQLGRIGMYVGYQHLIFQGLQQGILALLAFNDDDDKEIPTDKKVDYLNGVLDSVMRGTGILGGILSVAKNIAIHISRGDTYRSQNAILDVSPSIKSKYTKAQKIIRGFEKGKYSDVLIQTPSFIYGLPTDRVVKLVDQLGYGFDLYGQEYEKYQRIMMLLGWNHYNFYDSKPEGGLVDWLESLNRPTKNIQVKTEMQKRLEEIKRKNEELKERKKRKK